MWEPVALNECFRLNKYSAPSIGFTTHHDVPHVQNESRRSILSLLLYVNDGYEGGHTEFYKSDQKTLAHTYVPVTGSVLVFNQHWPHAGMPVSRGSKYVLRTDIMFQRTAIPIGFTHDWMRHPQFRRSIWLFREAQNQELDGNMEEASKYYKQSFELRLQWTKSKMKETRFSER